MIYPSISEYIDAIKAPEDNFDKLTSLRPLLDSDGRPIMSSGNFAVVFKMEDNSTNDTFAVRCFQKDTNTTKGTKSLEERINIISKRVKDFRVPYIVDYEFLANELFVDSKSATNNEQDVILMKWINGLSIKKYILRYATDKIKMKNLGTRFLKLCRVLRLADIAHGDLQHDNIIITESDEIKLIDYDSLYTPALGDIIDQICGYPDYQHPKRENNNLANVKLDYFSELVIYASIAAIRENPNLINDFKIEQSEGLLFSRDDFRSFSTSPIRSLLIGMGGEFTAIVKIFDEYLAENDINLLKAFDLRYEELTSLPEIITFISTPSDNVYVNDNITLSWKVNNATEIFIDDTPVDIIHTSKMFNIKNTKEFILRATNGITNVVRKLTVKTVPIPEFNIDVDKKIIRHGKNERCTLAWTCSHISQIVITDDNDQIIAESDCSGSVAVRPEKTTIYTITAVGKDGQRKWDKQITIEVFPESVVKFKTDKKFSLPTVPVTISWEVDNASKVEIIGDIDSPGERPYIGSFTIEPEKDTNVTIRVTDRFGVKEESIKIRMLPLPAIKCKPNVPQIKNEVKVQAAFVRPSVKLESPEIAAVRAIPFVPHVNIPDIHPNLHLDSPGFRGLKVEGSQPTSSWDDMLSLSNNLFNRLKSKISKYGNE